MVRNRQRLGWGLVGWGERALGLELQHLIGRGSFSTRLWHSTLPAVHPAGQMRGTLGCLCNLKVGKRHNRLWWGWVCQGLILLFPRWLNKQQGLEIGYYTAKPIKRFSLWEQCQLGGKAISILVCIDGLLFRSSWFKPSLCNLHPRTALKVAQQT